MTFITGHSFPFPTDLILMKTMKLNITKKNLKELNELFKCTGLGLPSRSVPKTESCSVSDPLPMFRARGKRTLILSK